MDTLWWVSMYLRVVFVYTRSATNVVAFNLVELVITLRSTDNTDRVQAPRMIGMLFEFDEGLFCYI